MPVVGVEGDLFHLFVGDLDAGPVDGEVEIRSLDMPRWALFAPVTLGFSMMAVEFTRCLIRGDSMSQAEADQAF